MKVSEEVFHSTTLIIFKLFERVSGSKQNQSPYGLITTSRIPSREEDELDLKAFWLLSHTIIELSKFLTAKKHRNSSEPPSEVCFCAQRRRLTDSQVRHSDPHHHI